ncbi:uncharacterized protein YfaS (alpha-2-macroglobulin family) [Ereboglobus sp. PH5-10]|uniref:alpha-2-macroglobulin family protein n=1 Tax=Ereboglobus sp. PH5-10 TaxID=2940629 RepID=UPI00240616E4|nr:MG2 domain-containing protein [Ereboglobus sp. PH5-10]MDF9826490.1 uncharacterized protein YfaS (alpha-2-macroglobulin family) [Ereboglobus sp. PH5-10]
MKIPSITRRLALLFFFVIFSQAPIAGADKTYEAQLAEAQRFDDEKSWALARDAYAQAQKLAPDDEARRWCELWLARAEWRTFSKDDWNWPARSRNEAKIKPMFGKLLAPYEKGYRERDAFWLAVIEERVEFHRTGAYDYPAMIRDLLEVSDYCGAKTPEKENTDAYVRSLRRLANTAPEYASLRKEYREKFIENFGRSSRLDELSADDRAWCALQYAHYSTDSRDVSAKERDNRWAFAVEISKNTQWDAVVRARFFVLQTLKGSAAGTVVVESDTPADLEKLRAQASALIDALAGAPDDRFVRETRTMMEKLIGWWTRPILLLDAPDYVAPGEPLRIDYATANCGELTVELLRFPMESYRPVDWWGLWRAGISIEAQREKNWRDGGTVMKRLTLRGSPAGSMQWVRQSTEIAEELPPGFYTISITGSGKKPEERVADIFVTSVRAIAVFHTEGPKKLFVYHNDSGEPVAGAKVIGILSEKEKWETVTDDKGYATLPVSNDKKGKGEFESNWGATLMALVDGQPVWFGENQFMPNSVESHEGVLRPNVWADVFFDRSLYRPGETVHWKIVARERNNGRFEPCRANLALTVEHGEETLIDGLPLRLNKYGTAHGDLRLPSALKPGNVRMRLSLVDAPSSKTIELPRAFHVDNYAVSGIEAETVWLNPEAVAQPDADVVFAVRARYYSGGPVGGARVHVSIDADVEREEDIGPDARRLLKNWMETHTDMPIELITDSNGEARLHLPQPAVRGLRRVGVKADVVLEGSPSVTARTSAYLARAASVSVGSIKASRSLARPGESVVFTVGVINAAREPCAFSGKARVMEAKWRPKWRAPDGSFVFEDELDAAKRRFAAKDDKRDFIPARMLGMSEYELSEVAVFDASGGADGNVTIPFTPPREGLYTVRLETDGETLDMRYSLRRDAPQLTVADDMTTELALPPDARKVIGLDAWRAGESLRTLVVLPKDVSRAVLVLYAENEIITRVVEGAGRRVTSVCLDRAPVVFGGVMYVIFYDAKGSNMDSGYVEITERVDTRLRVDIEPVPEKSRPGDRAEAQIMVRDSHGRPAVAEIAVAVSDQAVDALAGDARNPEIMEASTMWHCAPAQIARTMSRRAHTGPLALRDARPGALLNPSGRTMSFGGLLHETEVGRVFGLDDGESLGHAANAMSSTMSTRIRRHFSSTAFWAPEVLTDMQGRASVAFNYPDNLTRWSISALAVDIDGNRFGTGRAFTQTTLPFQARLQTPRFLIEGDRAMISARLVNRTDTAVSAEAFVMPSGAAMFPLGMTIGPVRKNIPVQAETVVTWPEVMATWPGDATFTLTAKTESETDGMALTIPVLEDGVSQQIATSARLAGDAKEHTFMLTLPAQLNRNRLNATLQLSPNQAGAMFGALPYLINYPYGCVEQTMSRFLPAVMIRKTFADLGVSNDVLEKRIMAGGKTRTSLDDIVRRGLDRIVMAERDDGGFGWWPDSRRADAWMTVYVAWGLALAEEAGIAVSQDLRDRTHEAIEELILKDKTIPNDTSAWMLGVVAHAGLRLDKHKQQDDEDKELRDVFERVYEQREKLSSAGRASLLLASSRFASPDQRAVLLRNLENGARRVRADGMGDTVHWGSTSGYWRAADGAVESTALMLIALLRIDAAHPHVEPAVNWLVLNRRGTAWENTRATAFALIALNQYMKQRAGESAGAQMEILINGNTWRTITLDLAALLAGETCELPIDAPLLRENDNAITLRRLSGSSPVYAVALATAWARGDSLKPASHLVAVSRDFTRQKVTRTVTGAVRIDPMPMSGSENAAQAGEQVVARVKLDVPNDLEYVMIAVPKPAGCEPINARSGWDARLVRVDGKKDPIADEFDDDDDDDFDDESARVRGHRIYREEHDDHSAFFLDHVEAGEWEIRFTMRAITPGDFRALPVKVEAMYVPEIRANSDARRVRIDAR